MMFRWLYELVTPPAKCARVGHRIRPQERSFFRYPSKDGYGFFGGVADDVVEERNICSRCNVELTPWVETSYSCLQSISLPASRMRELKKTGRLDR